METAAVHHSRNVFSLFLGRLISCRAGGIFGDDVAVPALGLSNFIAGWLLLYYYCFF